MALSANDPRPKHRQIADWIVTQVIEGEWAPGDRLPSARELMEMFDVSNQTAQSAVKSLQADGLAVGVPGRGSFLASDLDLGALVASHSGDQPSQDYVALRDQLDQLMSEMAAVHERLDRVESALADRPSRRATRS